MVWEARQGVGSKGGVTVPLRVTLTHGGGPSFLGLSMGYHEMMGGGDGGGERSSAAMTTTRQNGEVRKDVLYEGPMEEEEEEEEEKVGHGR